MMVIMFSDLECDYINPIDLCNKLNQFVLPEMEHMPSCSSCSSLMEVGCLYFLIYPWLLITVMNNRHMYDATEIFRTLSQHKKECFIKLGFYLICFFYFLYRMIVALIAADS
ncbi:unnamed protein product [Mucor hiemalis]